MILLPDLYLPYVPWGSEYVHAANEFLSEQMLFGSAYPVASFSSILEGYRKAPFEKDVLEKVLYQNAVRLLGLEHPQDKKEDIIPKGEKGKILYYSAPSPFVSAYESKKKS